MAWEKAFLDEMSCHSERNRRIYRRCHSRLDRESSNTSLHKVHDWFASAIEMQAFLLLSAPTSLRGRSEPATSEAWWWQSMEGLD